MKAVLINEAENNLKSLVDDVVDNLEEVIIVGEKQAVLISIDEYNSLKETFYLLSSKKNRKRLLESINEVENGNIIVKDIE